MRMHGRQILYPLLVAMVLAATSWASGPSTQNSSKASPRNPAKYEAWLQKEVRHELVLLPFYSVFDNLEFKTAGDQVTLLGQVVRPTTKSDAEARVKQIEGVSSVVNQIEVLPVSPLDDQLRRAVFRAIYSDPVLQKYALQAVKRSEEHTSELQSLAYLVCRLLLEKKKKITDLCIALRMTTVLILVPSTST